MHVSFLERVVFWNGIGHLVLGVTSLFIPRILRWATHLACLPLFFKQMFWTYAGYILAVNLAFGFLSVFGASELLNQSFLATGVTLFIALYWLARVAIQLFYFDTSFAPSGFFYRLGEIALTILFLFFSLSYTLAFVYNNRWI